MRLPCRRLELSCKGEGEVLAYGHEKVDVHHVDGCGDGDGEGGVMDTEVAGHGYLAQLCACGVYQPDGGETRRLSLRDAGIHGEFALC